MQLTTINMVTSAHIANVILHTNLIGRVADVCVIVNVLNTTA